MSRTLPTRLAQPYRFKIPLLHTLAILSLFLASLGQPVQAAYHSAPKPLIDRNLPSKEVELAPSVPALAPSAHSELIRPLSNDTIHSAVVPMTPALDKLPAPSHLPSSGRLVALAVNSGGGKVVATDNFLNATPTWTDITGPITGTPLVVRLDPSDPDNKAFVLTTNGLWYTTNLQSNPPTWTNVLTATQMRAATEANENFTTGYGEGQMMLSPNDVGYVGLLVSSQNANSVWFGRTSDAPGGANTWTWTAVAGTPYRGSSLWVSQHNPQRVYMIQVDGFPQAAKLRASTDGGSTWTVYSTVSFWDGVPYLFLPEAFNDTVIYIGGVRNPTQGTAIVRSANGPTGPWVGITPTIGVPAYAPNYAEAFAESPASNGLNLYLAGSTCTCTNPNDPNIASALFKWNGSTWTVLQSASGKPWVGQGLSGWTSNTSWLQMHDAGFGAGHVGFSQDGGVTWADHTGNLLSVAPGIDSVKYLTPPPNIFIAA